MRRAAAGALAERPGWQRVIFGGPLLGAGVRGVRGQHQSVFFAALVFGVLAAALLLFVKLPQIVGQLLLTDAEQDR